MGLAKNKTCFSASWQAKQALTELDGKPCIAVPGWQAKQALTEELEPCIAVPGWQAKQAVTEELEPCIAVPGVSMFACVVYVCVHVTVQRSPK